MTSFVVDVEADGPCPGQYSMVSIGAVVLKRGLEETFYGQFAPISEDWIPDALAVSGHTRDETLGFDDPEKVMKEFATWIKNHCGGRAVMWSDNSGFDWQFVNYYMHKYIGSNPFGHSCHNINDVYKGLVKDTRQNFKHLRDTKHTHHPVDDAIGNAEAMIKMHDDYQLKMRLQ